eukprot:COSAG06_NODE_54006_length_297_cov_0.358586_1_plen_59_part_01
MATLTDGTFEFAGAGQLLVGAACVVRALDGACDSSERNARTHTQTTKALQLRGRGGGGG